MAFQIDESSNCDKVSEEKATTKVQAAIRRFLVRKKTTCSFGEERIFYYLIRVKWIIYKFKMTFNRKINKLGKFVSI